MILRVVIGDKKKQMDLSRETDNYIRESIEHSLGLSISRRTLELKLQVYEQALLRLRDQYLFLRSKLNEKDDIIERSRVCNLFPNNTLSLDNLDFVEFF